MNYDIVNSVLNAARARVTSEIATLLPVGGTILDRNQRETQQMTNNAWRSLQAFLSDLGFARFELEAPFSLPRAGTTDPLAQMALNWDGCFDGAVQHSTPVLPNDFIQPLRLWERPRGLTKQYMDMDEVLNGMPSVSKAQHLGLWEWRDDTLFTPGSVLPTDIRVRYSAYMADFADDGTTPWFAQPVPIVRCQGALSLYLCSELATAAKLPDAAATFLQDAEDAARKIYARDTEEPKRTQKTSEYGRMSDARTPQKADLP